MSPSVRGPHNEPERIRIDVDVRRALEVLSGNVFAGHQACIRELVANASDSITQLSPEQMGSVEIRLQKIGDTLEVSDTGVGMTKSEAIQRLGTIFGTTKADRDDTIGRFGIGFYSCFPLCSVVEVFTRTRQAGDPGTRVVYSGDRTLDVEEFPVERPGTTVKLHLLASHRAMLDTAALSKLVRKDCAFIPYPVYVGPNRDLITAMNAAWYREASSEVETASDLKRFLHIEQPLVLFPIHGTVGRGTIHGCFFILRASQQAALRVYSHRILITESEQSLFDEHIRSFISGVVDVDDLPLVISRDGILTRSAQANSLRRLLLDRLGEGLSEIAKNRNEDFRSLMAEHGASIKRACVDHPELKRRLRDVLPYRSSLRAATTVPEYLTQRSDRIVIYADDLTVGASLLPLYQCANIEVLFMTDAVDGILREDWIEDTGVLRFQRLDENPPSASTADRVAESSGFDATLLDMVQLLFRSAVEPSLRLQLRPLGHDAPPAILALDQDARRHLEMIHAVRSCQKEGRTAELPPEVQRLAKAGFFDAMDKMAARTIILNRSNEVVNNLLERLRIDRSERLGSELDPLIAKFLYSQALLASGLPLPTETLADVSHNQTLLIIALLSLTQIARH